jgi:hypothetical protein
VKASRRPTASGIRRRDHQPAQNPGAATPVPERGGRHRDPHRDAAIFATSYSLVLGRATPHRITIGLVGSPAEQRALLAALKRATHGGLAFHPYAADAAAEEAIDDQAIYAALVLDQGIPRVLVWSASGYSVARVLEMAAEQIELETGLRRDRRASHRRRPGAGRRGGSFDRRASRTVSRAVAGPRGRGRGGRALLLDHGLLTA